MKQIVLDFEGWCRLDADKIQLMDCQTNEIKYASDFLRERGNIDGLVVYSFTTVIENAEDLEYGDLTLSIEDDEE